MRFAALLIGTHGLNVRVAY